jgi:radical SAM-linked protein
MIRIRLTYEKGATLKYTGHLDLHKVWERTFRRAQLPLAYSQGFHPQPRIQQACPLPLGFISQCEVIDFWLKEDLHVEEVELALVPALQPGIEIAKIESVPLSDPPLQTIVIASDYFAHFIDNVDGQIIADKIKHILSEPKILRERRGKSYDLRQLIQQCYFSSNPKAGVFMKLTTLPGATGRPEEVLDALGIDLYSVQVIRTGLFFST